MAEQHKQQAAQTQAQQQAADPLFQLEQAKVKVQEMEVTRKAQKDQTDAEIAAAKLVMEKERVQIEADKEANRVKAQESQAQQRLKLDALKVLATPKQQPKAPGNKG